MKKMFKSKTGVTLIALIITIILLLILATVTISALTGENGLITSTKRAEEQHKDGEEKEETSLNSIDDYISEGMDISKGGHVTVTKNPSTPHSATTVEITLSGDSEQIEYSINNGSSYIPYTAPFTLTQNLTLYVKVRW